MKVGSGGSVAGTSGRARIMVRGQLSARPRRGWDDQFVGRPRMALQRTSRPRWSTSQFRADRRNDIASDQVVGRTIVEAIPVGSDPGEVQLRQ